MHTHSLDAEESIMIARASAFEVPAKPLSELEELDDGSLIAKFLEGEKQTFTTLVGRYHRRLLLFIYNRIHDRDRAEDLVQETFLRVYRHLHRFDQSKNFSTWAYTIAANLVKNERRNRSRSPLVLFRTIRKDWDGEPEFGGHEESSRERPDEVYRQRCLRELIDRAVEQLPEHHKIIFILREMEDLKYEEISEITGVNLGTVKSRLNRARSNFAKIIAPMID